MSESPSVLVRALIPLGVIILLAVAAAIILFFLQSQSPSVTKPMAHLPAPESATAPTPAAFPVSPQQETAVALPDAPDSVVPAATPSVHKGDVFTNAQDLWTSLQGSLAASVGAVLAPEEFVRKFTISIYGLSEGRLVAQNRPYNPPEGLFAVAKLNDGPQVQFKMLPQNANRYAVYLEALHWANTDAGIALYERSYPQLQAAFEELGIGKRSFHQIAIMAIDNLLAAPDVSGDLILEQPKMRYSYLDAEIEKLPAAHKLMLRIGAKNNHEVKQLLRQLRQRLVAIKF
jgi:Protein of unknown function (DUF3014)